MTKRLALASLILASVVFSGCGGSDDGDSNNSTNPFAGRYTGTFTDPDDNSSQGTSAFTVSDSGRVTGTLQSPNPDFGSGSLTGTIRSNGTLSGSATYSGQTAIQLSGTITATSNGFSGRITQSVGGQSSLVDITGTRVTD